MGAQAALVRAGSAFRPAHRRALRDGLVIAGLVYLAYRFLVIGPLQGTVGGDAVAYWSLDPAQPYSQPNGEIGAFLYPPPVVRVLSLARNLSWVDFWWLWTAMLLGTAIWLGWRRALLVLAFPPVAIELYFGNLNLLIAAAVALAFRYPAAWAFILLTKVTPGVGLLWFAVRREWRKLGIAVAVTAFVVIASFAIDAPLWTAWLRAMARDDAGSLGWPLASPLWLRLLIAAVVVVWGARTDRPWTVPIAATVALPVVWIAGLSILTAIIAIERPELRPMPRATPIDTTHGQCPGAAAGP